MTEYPKIGTEQALRIDKAIRYARDYLNRSNNGNFESAHNFAEHAGLNDLANELRILRDCRFNVAQARQRLEAHEGALDELLAIESK